MAKIVSPVWSIIRGSIAGITYTANQYHQIIARQRTAPVQPNTGPQGQARSAFSAAGGIWSGLSALDQNAWDQYAKTAVYQGPAGNYTVPGRQIFIAGRQIQNYCLMRLLTLPSFLTGAPAITGFLLPQNVTIAATHGVGTGIGVDLSADAVDDTLFLVQISIPFTQDRLRFKGPFGSFFNQIKAVIVPGNTSVTMDFLGLNNASVYFVRVKAVADDTSPRVSQTYYLRAIADVVGP